MEAGRAADTQCVKGSVPLAFLRKSKCQIVKQKRERAEFENFLRISGKSFDRFSSGDEPEPDIIAHKGDECFGVEITNFHRQDAKQRESEEDLVIERAAAVYAKGGGPHLDVSVTWAPHFKIRKQDRDHLAHQIAALVRQNIPQLRTPIHLDWQNFESDLMAAISDVWINRLIDFKHDHWHAARAGCVPNWDAVTLQKEIDENNSKPARYNGCYRETWLLIVSSFGAPSAWMEMTDEVKKNRFQSSFDRVFLLSSFPLDVVELQMNR
jgi:hypothetical protein